MTFTKPVELKAHYKITTPLFLGDADQGADAQYFRNASIKGALRFWWRALQWGVIASQSANEQEALKQLHQQEGELFGTASGSTGVQSRFVITTEFKGSKLHAKGGKSLDSLSYLLGQGLYKEKVVSRDYLDGGELSLTVRFKPGVKLSAAQQKQLEQAMIALGVLGGLGSRARKGFGSLAIQQIETAEGEQRFEKLEDIEQFIHSLNFTANDDAPLTAFTQSTQVDASLTGRSARGLLQSISNELHAYRDGTDKSQNRENNFPEDRQIAQQAAQGNKVSELPKRSVFGLPHSYQWKQSLPKLEIKPKIEKGSRRASPLFIHIHEFPNQQCVAIQTLLPTRFLPKNTNIEFKAKHSQLVSNLQPDYSVITRYLARFKERKVLRHGK